MENDTFYVSTSKGRKMRAILIDAFLSHTQGHIDKHIANVEVYLHHPVGVGEHPDIMEAIETEMEEVAKYHDLKEMMERYFIDKDN